MHDYKVFRLSQEPKLFGVSVFLVVPIIFMSIVGFMFNKILPMSVFGIVSGGFLYAKFGVKGMRYFYSYLYWCLPKFITQILLPNSPDSSKRIYRR